MGLLSNIFTKAKTHFRKDGWYNLLANIGSGSSRTYNTYYARSTLLDQDTLTNMYATDGISKRIVDMVVDDSIRSFICGDPKLLKELNRIGTKQSIIEAAKLGRLYGGALLIAFVDDGLNLEEPLNLKGVHKLCSLRAVSRYQVRWTPEDLSRNLYGPHFGEPEIFTVTNNLNAQSDLSFRVHRSRCFVFHGNKVPSAIRIHNQGWHDSVLQCCYDALVRYGIVQGSTAEIVQDFVQVIFKINGLADKMMTEGGSKVIQRRLDLIDRSRSVSNSILIDAEAEDYEKKSSSVSGIDALWDRFSELVCSVSGIPATRLFGRSPAGLNSTGDSDMQNWHDLVGAYRVDQIAPCIDWIIEMLKVQQTWKERPKNYSWVFPPLAEPDSLELAELKKKYADIDAIYMDRGAISPVDAWQERFGQGKFNQDIKLKPPQEDEEVMEENEDLLQEEEKKESKTDMKEKALQDLIAMLQGEGHE